MARFLIIAYTNYSADGRVKREAQALASRGDEVDVICLSNPQNGLHHGVNVIGLEVPRYRGASRTAYLNVYARFFIAAARVAMARSRERPYAVAIVCTMPDVLVVAALPLRLRGAKIVLDIHDTMPELYRDKFAGAIGAVGERMLRFEERISASLADLVLAVHQLHRDRLESTGIPAKKIRVVMNTPDTEIFAPRAAVAEDGFTVACHGTIARRLGHDIVMKAMAIVRERSADIRLLMIGDGEYLSDAKQFALRSGLRDRVRFEHTVAVEQLPGLLAQASLGIVPNPASKATHLMLPVKLLEYAYLGIPVVTSRLRTIEYYFDADSVRFFEANNPDDLARKILELRESPAQRRTLALNARRIVNANGWERQRASFYEAIDSLIAPNKAFDPPTAMRGAAGGSI